MIEPTEEQMDFAERADWLVDAKAALRDPRAELTAHLFAGAESTLCGLPLRVVDGLPATEHHVPCRTCSDTADPAGQAALMPDEHPL